MKVVLGLIFLIFCSTGGEIAMTYGMKQVGELQEFRVRAVLRFLWKAASNPWIWVAIPLLAASFYSLLILLSWAPISLVIPASAFNYVVGTFGAKYLLKEDVNAKRWIGVCLVCAGVALVLITG